MGIVVKFILKNIYEKKFRTFLIVFSVMLSSALFFASGAISGTMLKMYENRLMQYYGSSEILVQPNEKSPSQFINLAGISETEGKPAYAVGAVQMSANYKVNEAETVFFALNGIDLEDLQLFNPVGLYSQETLTPFEGRKVIISKYAAGRFGFKSGDSIELSLAGTPHRFRICALADSTGPFLDESQTFYAIVPRETLASLLNARGRVNIIYIKPDASQDKSGLMDQLKQIYKRYDVREPFSREEFAQQMSSMTTPFMLMSVIVTLMSVFIIYTSFKVVTMERLPVIGTFRSIGATKKTTNLVLVLESLAYGVIGGGAGCLLGIGILYVMAFFTRPVGAAAFKTTIDFKPSQLLTAFIAAVLLAAVSCILPIIKISRIPVKDIVLNIMQKAAKKTLWKLLSGIILVAFSLIVPAYTPPELSLMVNNLCMLTSITGVVMLVPYMTSAAVLMLERLYGVLFGNIGVLAVKNLKGNKSVLNNISLLAIGISSLLMINTISNCVVKEVANFYRDARFDIWMHYAYQADRNLEGIIRQVDGVAGTCSSYQAGDIEVVGQNGYRISALQGIDGIRYPDYWNVGLPESSNTLFKELLSGKNLILSTTLKEKFGVQKGDILTLKIRDKEKKYTIIGFVNTLYNNGSTAYISESNYKLDTGDKYYSSIYIKSSGDPDRVTAEIKKKLSKRPNYTMTVNAMAEQNRESNDNMFIILKGFSIMALVIGIFGILNNLIISFIERRRTLAMLRFIGMSRKQMVSMIFIEALSAGMVGGIAGIFAGFLQVWVIPYVLKAINLYVPIRFPYGEIVYYIAAGVIITVIASISPAFKSSRLNVIEAVKYE